MQSTRVDRLLKGYRNHPPVDRERLEGTLIRLSQLVTDFPQIAELDINPLVVKNGRPIAVDARVVLKPTDCPAPMHLAVSPYPAQYESRLSMPDVGELLIRPIRPDDAELLVELFDTLSPQSIYYRFFSPVKQLSPTMLARFTQIDYDREIALVAILESGGSEKMLGAARIILQHNLKDAEFAVLVGDPWHGRGIGAHLLATCLDIARDRRFRSIWGTVLAENKGMLALGRKLGFTIKRAEQSGEFELTLDMSRLPPGSSVSA
jgi:acetyltransferase